MTNILIVLGHPDPDGGHLCHAIADAYQSAAQESGHLVDRIEIAHQHIPYITSSMDWESGDLPVVAVDGQAAVRKAQHIVFIYPLWMGDIPAKLKAWIEQVMRPSFAFDTNGAQKRPALKGKSAHVIVTMGMPGFVYKWFFLAHSLRSLDRNILKFCGIKPVGWSILGNVEDPKGLAQRRHLGKAAQLGRAAR
jgi:putative NADPH-quinone reductase